MPSLFLSKGVQGFEDNTLNAAKPHTVVEHKESAPTTKTFL